LRRKSGSSSRRRTVFVHTWPSLAAWAMGFPAARAVAMTSSASKRPVLDMTRLYRTHGRRHARLGQVILTRTPCENWSRHRAGPLSELRLSSSVTSGGTSDRRIRLSGGGWGSGNESTLVLAAIAFQQVRELTSESTQLGAGERAMALSRWPAMRSPNAKNPWNSAVFRQSRVDTGDARLRIILS
jgi:hypothetical protein